MHENAKCLKKNYLFKKMFPRFVPTFFNDQGIGGSVKQQIN